LQKREQLQLEQSEKQRNLEVLWQRKQQELQEEEQKLSVEKEVERINFTKFF